jgi:hypothetical protein
MDGTEPRIVAQTDDYAVVYKPRAMHSAPLSEGEEGTLLSWCGALIPEVLSVRGKKASKEGCSIGWTETLKAWCSWRRTSGPTIR